MTSHTGSSKRAFGAGESSSVERAALRRIGAGVARAARAAKRRRTWEREVARTGVPALGRVALTDMVAVYGENTVADVAGVKVKMLRRWTSGDQIAPAPARARLHVLRAAQKHLGQDAPRWLVTGERNVASPAALLRAGRIDDAWAAFHRVHRRARARRP